MTRDLDDRIPYGEDDAVALYRLQVRELEDAAMFLLSPEGRIRTWNRGVAVAFGYPENEFVGQSTELIFTEEDRAAGVPVRELETAAKRGRAADVRWHVRKDGTRVYMTGVLRALRDDEGKLIGFSKICLDDTPRKHLEDALTQSNIDLQQFAFVASHDMQEPLRTITTFSELLQRRYGGKLEGDGDQLLTAVVNAGRRMSTLIRDLLAYSQLSEDRSRVGSVHLDEDLEAALSLLRTSIEETGAVVTHDPLPEVRAERGQVMRLFQNLIGNAIKFRKPGDVPRIHVSAEPAGKFWKIRIRDNGIGFSQSQAENIFAPFKRLHGPEYPGSGIGLAACTRIVERHGGQIAAESQPGQGSMFWFTLPEVEPPQPI